MRNAIELIRPIRFAGTRGWDTIVLPGSIGYFGAVQRVAWSRSQSLRRGQCLYTGAWASKWTSTNHGTRL